MRDTSDSARWQATQILAADSPASAQVYLPPQTNSGHVAPSAPEGSLLRAGPGRCHRGSLRWGLAGATWALLAGFGLVSRPADAKDSDIRLNSIGYVPGRAKVASIAAVGTTFSVKRASDNTEVLAGKLSDAAPDPDTRESIQLADFSSVTDPGEYYLEVPGVGRSIAFKIDADAYKRSFTLAMAAFYAWRANTDVTLTVDGITWAHKAGQMNDGLLDYVDPAQSGVIRDGLGGWYDAGDYGKYVVNAGITVGMLLSAWEEFPALKEIALPIPAAQNSDLPDFLDEIRWETDWILKMQYSPTDGRVSHKLTSLKHDGMVLPEKTTAARYFVPYSSAAIADFVAILAKASRAFKPYDPAYAEKCLNAALVSYQWLKDNPANVDANQTGFSTGTYITGDPDDRLWAAAELLETTQDPSYAADFDAAAAKIVSLGNKVASFQFDWANTAILGSVTYLRSTNAARTPATIAMVSDALVAAADLAMEKRRASRYGRTSSQYNWGSNGIVANTCLPLQAANRIKPNPEYLDACSDQIAYIYGRNCFNRSQVTQDGKDPPLRPHDRRSAGDAINEPYPGYIVGGPNPDAVTWKDVQSNYQTNEVAINWQGGLVYALAGFVQPGAWSGTGGKPIFSAVEDLPVPAPLSGAAPTPTPPTTPAASGGAPATSPTAPPAAGGITGAVVAAGNSAVGSAGANAAGTGGSTSTSPVASGGAPATTDDSGCGCRAAGGDRSANWAWLSVLGAALSLARRRKSVAGV